MTRLTWYMVLTRTSRTRYKKQNMKNRLKIKLKNDCSAFSSAVNWWWRYLTDKLSNRCEARIVEVPDRRRPRTTGLQQGTISARPQPRDKKPKTPYLRWTAKRRTSSTHEHRVRSSLRIGNEHEKHSSAQNTNHHRPIEAKARIVEMLNTRIPRTTGLRREAINTGPLPRDKDRWTS